MKLIFLLVIESYIPYHRLAKTGISHQKNYIKQFKKLNNSAKFTSLQAAQLLGNQLSVCFLDSIRFNLRQLFRRKKVENRNVFFTEWPRLYLNFLNHVKRKKNIKLILYGRVYVIYYTNCMLFQFQLILLITMLYHYSILAHIIASSCLVPFNEMKKLFIENKPWMLGVEVNKRGSYLQRVVRWG